MGAGSRVISPVALREVHRQRLRRAVEAAESGEVVRFRLLDVEKPTLIVWYVLRQPNHPHVVANAWSHAGEWLQVIAAEFERMRKHK